MMHGFFCHVLFVQYIEFLYLGATITSQNYKT